MNKYSGYKRVVVLIATIFLFRLEYTFGQQNIEVRVGDNVVLEADEYRGTIQWQSSTDYENWIDIPMANATILESSVTELPMYFRALILEEGCEPHHSDPISLISDGTMFWSDPNAWQNNQVPAENDEVLIPSDRHVILDVNTPQLAGLTIEGTLEFDLKDLELTSEWIVVQGRLQIGSESEPFEHKAIITLNDMDTEADVMNMGTRGIMVMNGLLDLHGRTTTIPWTRLDVHASQGSSLIQLTDQVDWKDGDEIVIAPTDFYEAGNRASITEKRMITNINEASIEIDESLDAFHWGLLQYATNSGMSLENSNLVTPPIADTETEITPLILDERAEVGNLSRNIVIQAPDDDLWNNQGFGVHTMIMPNAQAYVEGVEFRRAGQRGRLRRYPFHWHMLSYVGSETLDDAEGQYLKNSTINSSTNRGIVIHGTNGVEVSNNIVYDIRGHGIFTEDAVERRNTITGNLVLHVRNPITGTQLKMHEIGGLGSSGFWISNPDNTITNNTAADCGTFGFWMAFPEQPWGESISVLHDDGMLLRPNRLQFGIFENNTSHSNRLDGIMIDNVEIDNDGNTFPRQYISTTDGREISWPYPTLRRFTLSNYKTWKNGDNGIWDRAVWATNTGIVSADNCGRFFAGSGADGLIERSLVVGTSLNHLMNGTDRPVEADFAGEITTSVPVAFATYHSAFDIRYNIVINFPIVENTRSGAFATEDYYIRPVERGQIRNVDNLLINSHAGVKLRAPYSYFTLASALWDPHGIWGPAENYIVYDEPFLTYDKEVSAIEPGAGAGGVSVSGPFYGFEGFILHGEGDEPPQNRAWFDLMGIHVRRLDDNLNEVATWTVNTAQAHLALQHMRDFATSPDGIYELTFPDEMIPPTDFRMNVENMLTPEDVQVIGIEFDGNLDARVFMIAYNDYLEYSQVNSKDEVINSTGQTYWQDNDNDMVWVKMQGGHWSFWTDNPEEAEPTDDELLYETTQLRIFVPD